MANPFDKQRNFLHAMPNPKFRAKDFTRIEAGTTQDGTRIQSFQGRSPGIHPRLQHGLMVEAPGRPTLMVYGSFQEINNISNQMKTPGGIEEVAKSLRFPDGQTSQSYYLNEAPPADTHRMPSQEEVDRYGTAEKIFGKHSHDTALLDRAQEERRALREHKKELAKQSSPTHFHTSVEGQEHLQQAMAPKQPQPGSTLISEAGDISE